MTLLQELLSLNEGRIKNEIIDLIQRAMDLIDTDSLDSDAVADRIIDKLREIDNHNLTSGMDNEELIAMISPFLSEDVNGEGEDVADQGDLKPKILAKSVPTKGVTYIVVMDPHSEEVQIVDSSHKVYLQVPFIVWQQLARQG